MNFSIADTTEMVTDRTGTALVIKYNILYALSIGILTFDRDPF